MVVAIFILTVAVVTWLYESIKTLHVLPSKYVWNIICWIYLIKPFKKNKTKTKHLGEGGHDGLAQLTRTSNLGVTATIWNIWWSCSETASKGDLETDLMKQIHSLVSVCLEAGVFAWVWWPKASFWCHRSGTFQYNFLRQGLPLVYLELVKPGWPTNPRNPFTCLCWHYRCTPPCPAFWSGFWGPPWGPQAYTESALLTKPSP